MGWKGALRSIQAEVRRAERDAQRRQREYERQQRELARIQEMVDAEREVSVFENYIDLITSVHTDCGPDWDWERIRVRPGPTEPLPSSQNADRARSTLARYRPTILDRLLRRGEKRRAALEKAVTAAEQSDKANHEEALAAHSEAVAAWADAVALATRIIDGEATAYVEAIEDTEPFAEIEGLGSNVRVGVFSPTVVSARIEVGDETVIPRVSKSILRSGRLSVKEMPKGQFYALYQDYVCGAALRVARELTALLPLEVVMVHVCTEMLNPSTGHIETAAILSVAVPRATLQRLNFARLDPSEALGNFVHNMSFKKTKGFAAVEELSPDIFLQSPAGETS